MGKTVKHPLKNFNQKENIAKNYFSIFATFLIEGLFPLEGNFKNNRTEKYGLRQHFFSHFFPSLKKSHLFGWEA